MQEYHEFSDGDWIVHAYYGVGQIKGVEVKAVSGEETRYCKIKSPDSTFWVPEDQMDNELIRPIADPEEIERAIVTLQKPPEEMSSNYKTRQNRIKSVRLRNTPRAIARLIRDLRARRREKGMLNNSESGALRTLKQRLVHEWAVVIRAETDEVAVQLESLLNSHHS